VCLCCVYMWIDDGGLMSTIQNEATPALVAAQEGKLDVLQFLVLEANADPNQPMKV